MLEWWASEINILVSGVLPAPALALAALSVYQSVNAVCFMRPPRLRRTPRGRHRVRAPGARIGLGHTLRTGTQGSLPGGLTTVRTRRLWRTVCDARFTPTCSQVRVRLLAVGAAAARRTGAPEPRQSQAQSAPAPPCAPLGAMKSDQSSPETPFGPASARGESGLAARSAPHARRRLSPSSASETERCSPPCSETAMSE